MNLENNVDYILSIQTRIALLEKLKTHAINRACEDLLKEEDIESKTDAELEALYVYAKKELTYRGGFKNRRDLLIVAVKKHQKKIIENKIYDAMSKSSYYHLIKED